MPLPRCNECACIVLHLAPMKPCRCEDHQAAYKESAWFRKHVLEVASRKISPNADAELHLSACIVPCYSVPRDLDMDP